MAGDLNLTIATVPYDRVEALRLGTVRPDGDDLPIRLHHPARGIAKGQAAVLYGADTVLGSANISSTSAVTSSAAGSRTTMLLTR